MDLTAVLVTLGALVVGLLTGYVLARPWRPTGADPRQVATAMATQAALTVERDGARAEAARVAGDLATTTARAHDAEREVTRLTTALELAEQAGAERIAELRRAQESLTEQFRLLSQEALDRTSERLLAMTDERLKSAEKHAGSELEQRRQAVAALVKPIEEHLAKVASQIDDSERRRTQELSSLGEQVRLMRETGSLLHRETEQLKTALRRPEVRGSWGELQLRQVVELAGMVEHCDFLTQHTVSGDEGRLRPDLVVRLAGGRRLVVDAKVSISAFHDALNATDDAVRAERLAAHARHVRTHVDQLAAKSYWASVTPSPEFVIAFVPGEAMLAQALETDTSLVEYATAKGVLLSSPLTLIAMLRTAAYAWKETKLAENAQQVFEEGRGLYKRLGTMGDHLDRLGRSLTSSVKAYNQAVGSLERQVLPSARRLRDLEVVEGELAAPEPIEEPVRPLAAAELVVAADEARQVRALPAVPSSPGSDDEVTTDPRYGIEAGAEPSLFDGLGAPPARRHGSGGGA